MSATLQAVSLQIGFATGSAAQRAFTLLQLLVTITIITILMSLLIPVTSMVRETARKISCASNLRQTGLLEFAYANDHAGCLTPTFLRGDMTWFGPTLTSDALQDEIYGIHGYTRFGWCWDSWYAYLSEFVGQDYRNEWNQETGYFNYLICPSAPFKPKKVQSLASANHWYGGSSYGMNTAVLGDTGSTGIWDYPNGSHATTGWPGYGVGIPGLKDHRRMLAKISHPSDVILLAEHRGANHWLLGGPDIPFQYWTDAPFVRPPMNSDGTELVPPAGWGTWLPAFGWRDANARPLGLRVSHNGRSNYLFHDGHVAALTPWETCTANPAEPNLWTGTNP